jgi:hypothetical protein
VQKLGNRFEITIKPVGLFPLGGIRQSKAAMKNMLE